MYKKLIKFFPSKGNKLLNEEEEFPEFIRDDIKDCTYIRILIGSILFVWVRVILFLAFLSFLILLFSVFNFICTMNDKTKARRFIVKCLIKFTAIPLKLLLGTFTWYSTLKDSKVLAVYRKYLGEDYDFNKEKFSLYISNHHGWIESYEWMTIHSPGFLAKEELSKVPLLKYLLFNLGCLFIKRDNREQRNDIANQLIERQKLFYENKISSPLLIYPEGTTTNGKYILNFQKGAFKALLPIKPLYSKAYSPYGNINMSPMNIFYHMYYTFCFLWRFARFYELPVVEFTQFARSKKMENESDDTAYARIVNSIYIEVFDLTPSSKTYKDIHKYEKYCANKQ